MLKSHRNFSFLGSDLSKDSKLVGNQHAPVDNLTEKADLSCHQLDVKDAKGKEEEEETGE